MLGVYISLLSGYLITAYIAGSNMTYSQAVIINMLYIGLTSFLLVAILAFGSAAGEVDRIAFEMTAQRSFTPRIYLAYMLFGFLGIWRTRKPQVYVGCEASQDKVKVSFWLTGVAICTGGRKRRLAVVKTKRSSWCRPIEPESHLRHSQLYSARREYLRPHLCQIFI